jgi:hypothetical protein
MGIGSRIRKSARTLKRAPDASESEYIVKKVQEKRNVRRSAELPAFDRNHTYC